LMATAPSFCAVSAAAGGRLTFRIRSIPAMHEGDTSEFLCSPVVWKSVVGLFHPMRRTIIQCHNVREVGETTKRTNTIRIYSIQHAKSVQPVRCTPPRRKSRKVYRNDRHADSSAKKEDISNSKMPTKLWRYIIHKGRPWYTNECSGECLTGPSVSPHFSRVLKWKTLVR
jgi:hypothetical protein